MAKEKITKSKEAPKPKNTGVEIKVPEGLSASVETDKIKIKGPKGEFSKKFILGDITMAKKDDKIVLTAPTRKRADRAVLGTLEAHIQNMFRGVTDGVLYKMKIVYSHFPMNVKIQGDKLVIDNFLGEKHPRKATILKNVTIEIKGQDVTLKGIDKDIVSQTAANIEQTTKIRKRDLRVFQDGIYITEKDGKSMLR
jgi:large subunit ribosomal protein L6